MQYPRFILLLASILLLSIAEAQQKKQSLSFDLGASFPFGDYGKKEINRKGSGFAATGAVSSITYQKNFQEKFGFSLSLLGQFNPMSRKRIEQAFSTTPIAPFTVYASSDPRNIPVLPPGNGIIYPNWKFETKSLWIVSVMAGFYGYFPVKNKPSLVIQPRIMVGPGFAFSPSIKGTSKTDTSAASFQQTSSKSFALVGQVGMKLTYQLNQHYFFNVNVDVLTSSELRLKNLKATMVTAHGSSPGNPDYSISSTMYTTTGRQTIGTFNAGIGLGFRF